MARRQPDPTELSHEDYQNALSHENETDDSELFDNTEYDPLDEGILADEEDEVELDEDYNEDDCEDIFDDYEYNDEDSVEDDSFDHRMDEDEE